MKLLEELHQEIIDDCPKYFEVIDQAEKPSLFTNMAKLDERF